jgi:hypothetical protein
MPNGYKQNELANELGLSTSSVADLLEQLRNELALQTGRFFPLTDHEYHALTASIETYGVQTPIVLGQHIPLIDGRHRLLIAQQLDLEDIPAIHLKGLTPNREHDLAITLNVARRQLNQHQKRTLVQTELMRDPARTDRRIAAICGVDHATVGTIRRDMAHQERLLHHPDELAKLTTETPHTPPTAPRTRYEPETRIDRRGNTQKAPQPLLAARAHTNYDPKREELADTPLGYAPCCHGTRHAILTDGAGYRLEAR